MKKRTYLLILMVILVVIGLGACGNLASNAPAEPTAAPSPIPTANPNAAIVEQMVKALNDGDLEGSLAYFADDALVYFVGMPPTGIEIYHGVDEFRSVWEFCLENNFEWEIEIDSTDGDIVIARAKTWLDFTRDLGVAPNEFIDVYEITDGKITFYGSTITEEALAKFKPALAEVMPFPTPTPSSETPVSEVTVTIENDTCAYNGPLNLKAGPVTVYSEARDLDQEKYAVSFFTLDPDKDLIDLLASNTRPSPPPWSSMVFIRELNPGQKSESAFTPKEGLLYLVCWSGTPDLAIGGVGPFVVQP